MTDDSVIQWTFFNAIEHDNLAKATSVIEKVVSKGNRLPPQLLIDASQAGKLQFMTLLLDAGADIDAFNSMRQTACHAAIWGGHFDALKLLAERGANLNVDDGSLLAASAKLDAKNYGVINFLLDAGVTPESLTPDSLFVLVADTQSQSVKMLKRLLARNADLGAMRDVSGRSLCHYLVRGAKNDTDNMVHILRTLVDVAHVDVNAADDSGTTPLHCAAISYNTVVIQTLCELGADVNRVDKDGRSALHDVARHWYQNDRTVETLLALGLDVALTDMYGFTACHFAAGHGAVGLMAACLAAGADLDQCDYAGISSRQIAVHNGRQIPTNDAIAAARQRIARVRLDFVRERAFQICLALQSLRINALELCEIMAHSFGALGSLIAFHEWWAIATTVKHFHKPQ